MKRNLIRARRWLGESLVFIGVMLLPDEEERATAYAQLLYEGVVRKGEESRFDG